MSAIKIATALGLAIWLLPTGKQEQWKLVQSAAGGIERVRGFCDRNPVTCATAANYWATFKTKAEFAIVSAVNLAAGKKDELAENARVKTPDTAAPTAAPGAKRSGTRPGTDPQLGTLRDRDIEPVWRGKGPPANRP